jgi:hypothetical protein
MSEFTTYVRRKLHTNCHFLGQVYICQTNVCLPDIYLTIQTYVGTFLHIFKFSPTIKGTQGKVSAMSVFVPGTQECVVANKTHEEETTQRQEDESSQQREDEDEKRQAEARKKQQEEEMLQ